MTFSAFLIILNCEVPMMSVLYAPSMVGGKLLVGFTIPCSFFEFTLLNHCACQSANSHIERTHFGKCFFVEKLLLSIKFFDIFRKNIFFRIFVKLFSNSYFSAIDNILAMQEEAEKNGCKNITLEEINREIAEYRNRNNTGVTL